MVSLSNNDRFDNDKIFLRNIWHFSVITRINYVSIFFVFILKIHERIYKQYAIFIAKCRMQYNISVSRALRTFSMKVIARRRQYKRFKWKRTRVANITKVLNERECLS